MTRQSVGITVADAADDRHSVQNRTFIVLSLSEIIGVSIHLIFLESVGRVE